MTIMALGCAWPCPSARSDWTTGFRFSTTDSTAVPAGFSSVSGIDGSFEMSESIKIWGGRATERTCAAWLMPLLVMAASAEPSLRPLAGLPIYFEANRGQAAGEAQFLARGGQYQFLLAPAEAQIVLRKVSA